MNIAKFIFLAFFVLSFTENCLGFSVETHYEINLYIMKNMGAIFDTALKNYNLSEGVATKINGKTITQIIANGGIAEDTDGLMRYTNHFHNPLKPWNSSGLAGYPCNSAPVWAQQKSTNFRSWPAARDYFYLALTAENKDYRNACFVNCFTSLGQVMHLVEDMAVPAHVREDSHPFGNVFEIWVNNELTDLKSAAFDAKYLSPNSFYPDASLLVKGYNSNATIPIAGLFDADVYTGENPDITAGANVGMAEYTNANFFSENTMYMKFKYPSFTANVDIAEVAITKGGTTVLRPYYQKLGGGDAGYVLATKGFLKDFVDRKISTLHNPNPALDLLFQRYSKYDIYKYVTALDDICYTDYAARLLPRAAGYSSTLLSYFFRGQMEIHAGTELKDYDIFGGFVYSGVTLRIKNTTPGENMAAVNNSHFVVAYDYLDDMGNTVYGKTGDVSMNSGIPTGNDLSSSEYKYTFNFSQPIPSYSTDRHYMLVYRGNLGQEDDSVVANKVVTTGGILVEQVGEQFGEHNEALSVTFKLVNNTFDTVLAAGSTVEFVSSGGGGSASLDSDLVPGGQSYVVYSVYEPYGTVAKGTVTVTAKFGPGYTDTFTGEGWVGMGML